MQRTIHWDNKPTHLTHGQVTIFSDGTRLLMLTRERTKSVQAEYLHIGSVHKDAEGSVMVLWGDSTPYRLIAKWLSDNGRRVFGAAVDSSIKVSAYCPKLDGYSPALTSIESIRHALGIGSKPRRKSLNLGVRGKADNGPDSVQDMRAAILARQALNS